MEKFSQFRDRGTQIAPFLPIASELTTFQHVYGLLIFLFRLPFFLTLTIPYLLLLHTLPLPSLVRKAYLWSILGVSGIWWIDLQVAGVKRGSLASQSAKLPHPGTIIVSSYTSPLDALYLAAIFDPLFTISYPNSTLVQHVSLPTFLYRTLLCTPQLAPAPGTPLISLRALAAQNRNRTLLVFPECTPTNGRGILRFAPCLKEVEEQGTRVFPVSLRYSPADITAPVPGGWGGIGWVMSLLMSPTHCIRVRIGEGVQGEGVGERAEEALARIGRVKRVDLGVVEKRRFLEAWRKDGR